MASNLKVGPLFVFIDQSMSTFSLIVDIMHNDTSWMKDRSFLHGYMVEY